MLKKNDKSLIVCLTPLQMLIAEKIIKKKTHQFDLICVYYNENEKYNHYFHRVSKHCENTNKYLILSQTKVGRLVELFKFKFFIKRKLNKKYNGIYLASIDNPFSYLLLSILDFEELYTFDDGSANIIKQSNYYVYVRKSLIQKIFLFLLGNKYDIESIKLNTKMHYTIYPELSNIIQNKTTIDLSETIEENININTEVNIFLGQPFDEINVDGIDEILEYVRSKGGVLYFPHPREKIIIKGFEYIQTPLIIEDYVVSLISKGYNIKLFSILSTAALNVNFKNVKSIVICNKSLMESYKSFYKLVSKRNCSIEILDDILLKEKDNV